MRQAIIWTNADPSIDAYMRHKGRWVKIKYVIFKHCVVSIIEQFLTANGRH